jgi:hypothetical protein
MTITAQDLGAINDGVADDGALITAGLVSHFGTLATTPLHTPVEIDFGNYVYNLDSPIIIEQSFIRIIGEPKFQCNDIANAFVANTGGASANLFGVVIYGTITGTVTGDAVLLQQATQCLVAIRNRGIVGQAVSHFQGCYSCQSVCSSDNEGSPKATAGYVHRETVLLLNGILYNTINSNIYALGYYCTVSGIYLSESQGFTLKGDVEHAHGPGVHLINSQHGLIGIYTEANGQGATGGANPPDDVRIESGGGQVVMNSDANIFIGNRFGGEMINIGGVPTTPNNIRVVSGYRTYIEGNSVGGKIVLEAGADQTYVGQQARLLNPLENHGTNTIDWSVLGKLDFYASIYKRLSIDAQASGGARLNGPDGLLRISGIKGISAGQIDANNFVGVATIHHDDLDSDNLATIMLPTPEADANYAVFPFLWIVDGTAATRAIWFGGQLADRFYILADQKPGIGKAFNVRWLLIRTS